MHIVFFNRSYFPDLGATGQLLTELTQDLVHKYGCSVTVIAGPALTGSQVRRFPAFSGVPSQREWYNGVDVFRTVSTSLSPKRFSSRATNYLTYFLSACLSGLRVSRPDVVVSLTDPPIIGLAALLTARRSGARFVFLCQDIFPEVARLLKDFQNGVVNRILDRVNRLLIQKADRVVALGDTMRARLIEGKDADPQKVTVIHNWADCFMISPGPKQNIFSFAHGLADRFAVMHSGNIGLSQGLENVVDAAARLREVRDITFVFVGDGVKKPALEERVQALGLENIRFLPYQPKDGLRDSFATADVFVISLKRGLAGYIVPSKLYGILAAGRPYVAAVEDESEVAAITRKYDCGLLAEPGDPEDLAQKILTLYHDRELAQRLGANARRAALEFDRPVQVCKYYELFRELVPTSQVEPIPRPSVLKRPFDMALSGLGLLISAPLWALISLGIKLEDGGPVFYPQERVGKGGGQFKSWKFRSMIPDADRSYGPLQATENDHRVTRVGRLLRATAMDELPQLWNIFKGDMSFVGPRALLPEEIEIGKWKKEKSSNVQCSMSEVVEGSQFTVHGSQPRRDEGVAMEEIPGYKERHGVRPGLTGLAQVYAPRDILRRHKFRYDLLYIKKQTFLLDLKLIALSFWITFRGQWESRGEKF